MMHVEARAARRTAPGRPSRRMIQAALERLERAPVTVVGQGSVAEDRRDGDGKHVGYGEPVLVRYRVAGVDRAVVFRTMLPNWFGHDRRADRASLALLAHDTYGKIPLHVPAIDVGAVRADGSLVSLGDAGEFYLITRYAGGVLYARDLKRIETEGRSTELDLGRAGALAGYLVDLHAPPHPRPHQVYVRAIRDLIGSGEGIFGIADEYPPEGPIAFERLAAIEHRCIDWRWKLRRRARRVRRTHGDFHPYNVLFREGSDFTLLDASRGCVGEPADDVAAMTINYLFGGVSHPGAWQEGFRPLWETFWHMYLSASGDWELLEVIAPFFAWRALVVASPVWYPDLTNAQRERLIGFAESVLDQSSFDPGKIDAYAG
jgi:aminoglycoside phosphotransferase (APT) family kinase protein